MRDSEKSILLITIKWLTIIFIICKLIGCFPFSWLWVFAPLWLPILAIIGGATFSLIILTIVLTLYFPYVIILHIVKMVRIKRL